MLRTLVSLFFLLCFQPLQANCDISQFQSEVIQLNTSTYWKSVLQQVYAVMNEKSTRAPSCAGSKITTGMDLVQNYMQFVGVDKTRQFKKLSFNKWEVEKNSIEVNMPMDPTISNFSFTINSKVGQLEVSSKQCSPLRAVASFLPTVKLAKGVRCDQVNNIKLNREQQAVIDQETEKILKAAR